MMDIKVLDSITANQIAAGEVVEKPASVVKELVENALDAGATQIEVTIFEGGTEFIRVVDNGTGMTKDNAKLAILRHATSKISKAEDLLQLGTLGFRGEALPSIASVSKFRLVTRSKDKEFATSVNVEGGKEPEVTETGGNIGTTVVVEELFFNVPARRKFLKTSATEGRYISELLIKLAMSRPDVAFRLSNGEKDILVTSGDGDLKNTIRSLYGKDMSDHLLAVDYEYEGVKLYGYISKPTVLKNTRQWQTFFVNGRSVGSKMLAKAVDHAYQSMIPKNGFPFVVLSINLDKSAVDVNVHPQKAEVKFSDEGLIYRAVYHGLTDTLTKPASAQKVIDAVSSNTKQGTNEKKPVYNYEPVPIFKPKVAEPVCEAYTASVKPYVPFGEVADAMHKEEINFERPESKADNLTLWPIGQVDKTFIIAQSDTSLFLIDQHAAHERILYDKLVTMHEKTDVQSLLVPLYIDMDAAD
ncbi:MAG: DNA mismatch repair endonuclease MutL, partial [Acidaminococcaceae bacterium]|nr:DNA mismatch repair endonuclease MutL [Acidaminococcaceae bacterium]